jgi:YD repeat-containing protein
MRRAWSTADSIWQPVGQTTFNTDVDRVTSYVYDGAGHIKKQVAHVPTSTNTTAVQVTQYDYLAQANGGR